METKEIGKPEVEVTRRKPIQSMSKNERLDDFIYRVKDVALGDDLPRFVEAYTFYMCLNPNYNGIPKSDIESVNIHYAFMNLYSVLSELVRISKGEDNISNQPESKTKQLNDLLKRVEELEIGDDLPSFLEAYTFYMCLNPNYNGIPKNEGEALNSYYAFLRIKSFLDELVSLVAK